LPAAENDDAQFGQRFNLNRVAQLPEEFLLLLLSFVVESLVPRKWLLRGNLG
jgi:hypothetical protein